MRFVDRFEWFWNDFMDMYLAIKDFAILHPAVTLIAVGALVYFML